MRERHRLRNVGIADRFAASKHSLEAIAQRVDSPQQQQIGTPASHHRLDAGDLQPLSLPQRDVSVRRIGLHAENVPFLRVTHAEPQLHEFAALAMGRDRGWNGAAAVDYQQITGAKEAGQLGEAGVPDRLSRPVDDHQTNPISAQPAQLGREVGAKLRGQRRQGPYRTSDQARRPPHAGRPMPDPPLSPAE